MLTARRTVIAGLSMVALMGGLLVPVAGATAAPVEATADAAADVPAVIDLGDDTVPVSPALTSKAQRADLAAAALAGTAVDHSIFVSVVRLSPSNTANDTVPVPTDDTSASDFVDDLDEYWSAESGGLVNLVFADFETIDVPVTCNSAEDVDDIYNTVRASSFGGDFSTDSQWANTNNHLLILPIDDTACAGGLASLGGGGGVIVSGYGNSGPYALPTALHEFGHNLGFAHANASLCHNTKYDATTSTFAAECDSLEYGDYSDIMGFSVANSNVHLSSPQKIIKGYLEDYETLTVASGTVTRTIKPLGDAAVSGSNRALKIVAGGETYYVEYRTKDAADTSSYDYLGTADCTTTSNSYSRCFGTTDAATGGVRVLRTLTYGSTFGGSRTDPGTSVLAVGPVAGGTALKRDTHLDATETFINYNNTVSITVNSLNSSTGATVTVSFTGAAPTATSTTVSLDKPTTQTYSTTAVVATASVTAGATGKVVFFEDATIFGEATVTNGTASLALPLSLSVGVHSVEARFEPATSSYLTSTSTPVDLTVVGPTDTSIALDYDYTASGTGVILKATAANDDSSASAGTVTFVEGATTLGTVALTGGMASLEIPVYAAGDHSITVTFTPASAAYSPSSATYVLGIETDPVAPPTTVVPGGTIKTTTTTNTVVTTVAEEPVAEPVVPAKAKTKLTIKVPTKVKATKKAIITVTVSGSKPTGKITVYSNGKKLTTFTLKASAKGKAKITLPKIKKKATYKITVKYSGSSTFLASASGAKKLKVVK